VRVGWFRIAIKILGMYFGVQKGVAPVGWIREGCRCVVGVRADNRDETYAAARQRGWLLESDAAYGWRGKVWGGDIRVGCVGLIWIWLC
jgi:hypothetical protein